MKTENASKKRGRVATHNLPTRPVCVVSGLSPNLWWRNVKTRIAKYWNNDPEFYKKNYIHHSIGKRLREGETVEDIRKDYPDAPAGEVSSVAIAKAINPRAFVKIVDGDIIPLKEWNAMNRGEEPDNVKITMVSSDMPSHSHKAAAKAQVLPSGYKFDKNGRLRDSKGRMASLKKVLAK